MTQTTTYLYSIGHGQKPFGEFVQELMSFGIEFLVDVRSFPFSKWAPQFNRGTIECLLAGSAIRYAYMGDSIGGRPSDDECYDSEGFIDYRKMAAMPQFVGGLNRLVKANAQRRKVAVMCSESNPSECHRSKLIGRELYFGRGIAMSHITAPGLFRTQEEIMEELDKDKGNWPSGDLFGQPMPPYFKSCKPYKSKAEMSNYAEISSPYD